MVVLQVTMTDEAYEGLEESGVEPIEWVEELIAERLAEGNEYNAAQIAGRIYQTSMG